MNERAYKTIIAVLIAIIFYVTCFGIYKVCVKESDNDKTEVPDDTLIEIESHINYIIMYDKDTKVIYYRGLGGNAALCPLYNADGSLRLYSGGNNND